MGAKPGTTMNGVIRIDASISRFLSATNSGSPIPQKLLRMPKEGVIKTALVFAFLVFWFVTGSLSIRRSHRGSNDFDTYYAAGEAVLKGGAVYDSKIGESPGGEKGPFLYAPAAACFFSVFALFPLGLSAFLWNTLNLALFVGALVLAVRFIGLDALAVSKLWNSPLRLDLILAGGIGFVLLLDNLAMAQTNLFVFFLTLTALSLWKKRRHVLGGICLSAAILMKVTPALFCLYFLLKRSWRFLAGVLAGFVILGWVIPSFLLGVENNQNFHRQWFGKTFEPFFSGLVSSLRKEPLGHLWSEAEGKEVSRVTALLAEKNQSLEAALTRLLLKNRNGLADSVLYPFRVAQRYKALPVLGGGLPREVLTVGIRSVQAVLLLGLVFLWASREARAAPDQVTLKVSLVFLSMTLLSPLARSHQFITWLFVYLTILKVGEQSLRLMVPRTDLSVRILIAAGRMGCFAYFLQAVPYGKAIGMGAWANVILWAGVASYLILANPRQESRKRVRQAGEVII